MPKLHIGHDGAGWHVYAGPVLKHFPDSNIVASYPDFDPETGFYGEELAKELVRASEAPTAEGPCPHTRGLKLEAR